MTTTMRLPAIPTGRATPLAPAGLRWREVLTPDDLAIYEDKVRSKFTPAGLMKPEPHSAVR